jgi:3-phenylpropionate/trans-cinnamate dioxygenase ferredoxin subunit
VIRVCDIAGLPAGAAVRVEPAGHPAISVFNVDGEYLAVDDTCTHQDASLADGWLDGDTVECPLHATCFSLRTGLPLGPPAKLPVAVHPVTVSDGVIYVVPPAGTTGEGVGQSGNSAVGAEAGPPIPEA